MKRLMSVSSSRGIPVARNRRGTPSRSGAATDPEPHRGKNMNRAKLFLLLVGSALLGGGCNTCDVSDVALFWHLPNANNTAELTCDQAGVASVVITIDGASFDPLACTLQDVDGNPVQGITLTHFASGVQYAFQIDGLDSAGQVIYSTAFQYTPTGCGLKVLDETLTPLAGDLVIPYAFQGGGPCTPVSPASAYPNTYSWFQLIDQSGQLYSASDAQHDPTLIACNAATPTITIPGALFGRYTLAGVEEVEIGFGGTATVRRYNCTRPSFQHAAAGDTWAPAPVLG